MTTITVIASRRTPAAPARSAAGSLTGLWSRLMAALAEREPSAPQAARELRALADRYEASQPSYAADLRAAAERLS